MVTRSRKCRLLQRLMTPEFLRIPVVPSDDGNSQNMLLLPDAILGGFTKPRESRISETRPSVCFTISPSSERRSLWANESASSIHERSGTLPSDHKHSASQAERRPAFSSEVALPIIGPQPVMQNGVRHSIAK